MRPYVETCIEAFGTGRSMFESNFPPDKVGFSVRRFHRSYQVKYEKAAECLKKDRDALLTFYDFPAQHWKHLRTTNPIESTFATVRHRTIRSKGCLSNRTALAMVFKLVEAAQRSWRRPDGNNQLPKLILGVKFADGLEVVAKQANRKPETAAA